MGPAVLDHGHRNPVPGDPVLDEARHDGCCVNIDKLRNLEPASIAVDAGEEVPEPLRRWQWTHQVEVHQRVGTGISGRSGTVCLVTLDTWQVVHSLHYWFTSWIILYHNHLL